MNAMLNLAMKEGHKKCLPPSKKNNGGVGNLDDYKNAEVKRSEILKLLKCGHMTVRDIAVKTGENEHATRSRVLILRDRGKVLAADKFGAFTMWGLVTR